MKDFSLEESAFPFSLFPARYISLIESIGLMILAFESIYPPRRRVVSWFDKNGIQRSRHWYLKVLYYVSAEIKSRHPGPRAALKNEASSDEVAVFKALCFGSWWCPCKEDASVYS